MKPTLALLRNILLLTLLLSPLSRSDISRKQLWLFESHWTRSGRGRGCCGYVSEHHGIQSNSLLTVSRNI